MLIHRFLCLPAGASWRHSFPIYTSLGCLPPVVLTFRVVVYAPFVKRG